MAMRYLIRRSKEEDLSDVRRQLPDLDKKLGKAEKDQRRFLNVTLSPSQYLTFQFFSRQAGKDTVWTCPSVEVVADNELGILDVTKKLGTNPPEHLKHLLR